MDGENLRNQRVEVDRGHSSQHPCKMTPPLSDILHMTWRDVEDCSGQKSHLFNIWHTQFLTNNKK